MTEIEPDEPSPDIVWVSVPFTRAEFTMLQRERALTGPGTAWAAVRERMAKSEAQARKQLSTRLATNPALLHKVGTVHRSVRPLPVPDGEIRYAAENWQRLS